VGVYNLDDLRKKVREAAAQMVPPLRLTFTSVKYKGAIILCVEIPECPVELKPCYYKPAGLHGGSYIRVSDGDCKMNDYEIYMFKSGRSQATDDMQPVVRAKPKDLDEKAIEKYILKFQEKRPGSRLLSLEYPRIALA
jgi:ATP-dependent DNA helicase RecG